MNSQNIFIRISIIMDILTGFDRCSRAVAFRMLYLFVIRITILKIGFWNYSLMHLNLYKLSYRNSNWQNFSTCINLSTNLSIKPYGRTIESLLQKSFGFQQGKMERQAGGRKSFNCFISSFILSLDICITQNCKKKSQKQFARKQFYQKKTVECNVLN